MSQWRFQTQKHFRDFALENFLPKTVTNQHAMRLECLPICHENVVNNPADGNMTRVLQLLPRAFFV